MFGSSTPTRDTEFADFVRTSSRSLTRTAYLLCGDRALADDLVQEALLKTYVAWRRVRRDEAAGYTRRVLVNLNIDRWRRRPPVPAELAEQPVTDPGPAQVDDRDQIVRLLAGLPTQQRRVIVLRYFDDLSEAATAELLGISTGAVKSASSRGLAALRQHYQMADEGGPR